MHADAGRTGAGQRAALRGARGRVRCGRAHRRRRRPHHRQRHRRARLRRRPRRGAVPSARPAARPWARWPATSTCSSIRADRTVRIPRGVRLDLGSTAKALAADRAAARIAGRIGAGALVSLGGDVAVAGPPPAGGWADRHRPRVVDPGRRRSTRWWPSRRAAWPARPPRSGRGRRATVTSTTSSTRGPGTASSPTGRWSRPPAPAASRPTS